MQSLYSSFQLTAHAFHLFTWLIALILYSGHYKNSNKLISMHGHWTEFPRPICPHSGHPSYTHLFSCRKTRTDSMWSSSSRSRRFATANISCSCSYLRWKIGNEKRSDRKIQNKEKDAKAHRVNFVGWNA